MSYDLLVYTTRERLPGAPLLNRELSAQGISVPATFNLLTNTGFVSVLDAGFECDISQVEKWHIEDHVKRLREWNEPDDELLSILRTSDTFVSLGCQSTREIELARLVAGAIAKLSGGYVCDLQTGETVHGGYLSIPPLL